MPTVIDLGVPNFGGFTILGDAAGDNAAYVSDAGDVNGDGFADIIVGAPLAGYGATGAAYVIFGRPGGFGTIDLSNLQPADGFLIQGAGSIDYTGISVSSAGDINGDGFDDILVGTYVGGFYYTGTSHAYVIFGKSTGFATINLSNLAPSAGFVINGTLGFDNLMIVADAGDINGDGFDDIIIGDRGDSSGTGAAYVIFGKATGFGTIDVANLSSTVGFRINGGVGDRAGVSVSGAGDVNGDGFDDLIVGAYFGDNGGNNAGEAYVIFGKSSGFTTLNLESLPAGAGFIIQGDVAEDWAGFDVSAAGDVNGDGFDDLIVGAPLGDNGGTGAGEAYVILGKATGFGTVDLSNLGSAGFVIQGDASGDALGWSVSAAGDVNGDGFGDLIVGAPFGDNGGAYAGEAYVIFGRSTGFTTIDLTNLSPSDGYIIQGDDADDRAGQSVSAAGDVNGDGLDDIIVGARTADNGAGASYVIFGRRDSPADVSGDFNGDGRDDVLLRHGDGWITEWLGQGSGVFLPNGTASRWAHPAWHVTATGDFNGDGRDDVLLRHGDGWMTEWLGQGNGSFSDNGVVASGWFHPSWQVVGTGDFNGDNRDDVLLRHSDGTMVERLGQANGSFASNNAATDWVHPDWHVEATNDFNGDGRADLLLRHNNGWLVEWFGQADGSFSNEGVAGNWLDAAWHVAATGDFNGDGEDDILLRHSNGTIVEWLGQTSSGFVVNSAATTSLSAAWNIVSSGDFNGDMRDDLLLRHDDGTVVEWLSQMNGSFLANNAATTWVHPNWQLQPTDIFGF